MAGGLAEPGAPFFAPAKGGGRSVAFGRLRPPTHCFAMNGAPSGVMHVAHESGAPFFAPAKGGGRSVTFGRLRPPPIASQ